MFILHEAVAGRCSVKKVFCEMLQNSQENTYDTVSFLIKFQVSACNFIKKETLAQVLSCEFCKISRKTFFYKTPPVAASISRGVGDHILITFLPVLIPFT